MSFDQKPRDAGGSAQPDTHSALAPGKRTLVEGLPVAAVQRSPTSGGTAGAPPRRFEGVVTYRDVTEAGMVAAGFKLWVTEAGFDKWVKLDGSSELWVQLPKINAATSDAAISQLRSLVATRKAELDDLLNLLQLEKSPDPEVASAAHDEWQERYDTYAPFDDDAARVPALRAQVDAAHRKAFEDQVDQLVAQAHRYGQELPRP